MALARAIQLALLAAGIVLLAAMVRAVGIAQLAADLRRFGILALVAVVGIELALDACNTCGWRCTLAERHGVGFWRLFWIRQAGTAINQLTPTATMGGELVKTMLLKPRMATVDAVASVIGARMTFAVAQAVLVALGLGLALRRLHGAPDLALGLVAAAVLLALGVVVFVALQRRGMFAALARGGGRLGVDTGMLARLHAGGRALDERLGTLYRTRVPAVIASTAWHFAAQLVSVVQLFVILRWLGTPTAITSCLAIEACALVIDAATFLVPARIGVQEGGRVLVFTAFGFPAATGLAVALIVRLNQLAVAGIGLTAFAYFSFTSRGTAPSVADPEPMPAAPDVRR